MLTDLVLEPFGGDVHTMVETARTIDQIDGGIDGLWVYDHFTAMMSVDRTWSRDPFVLLGAYAATTERLRLGPLVANVYNRHPVQLASALSSLQSLADRSPRDRDVSAGRPSTRIVCGLGSGAAPGSRFAREQEAIGVVLEPVAQRRSKLIDTADAIRHIWATNTLGDAHDIVEPAPSPSIIFGASGPITVAASAHHVDGVNIRDGEHVGDLIELAREESGPTFEISMLTSFDPEHPFGYDVERFMSLGVDRVVLGVRSPFDPSAVVAASTRLARGY